MFAPEVGDGGDVDVVVLEVELFVVEVVVVEVCVVVVVLLVEVVVLVDVLLLVEDFVEVVEVFFVDVVVVDFPLFRLPLLLLLLDPRPWSSFLPTLRSLLTSKGASGMLRTTSVLPDPLVSFTTSEANPLWHPKPDPKPKNPLLKSPPCSMWAVMTAALALARRLELYFDSIFLRSR